MYGSESSYSAGNKSWAPIENYNPDCNASFSQWFCKERDHIGCRYLVIFQVRGLGVMCVEAIWHSSSGEKPGYWEELEMGIFTKEDIGYAPGL